MKPTGTLSVVELDGDRLLAVSGQVSAAGVVVRAAVTCTRPERLAADDMDAVGAWVRAELDSAGIGRGRVVLALPRGDVVLKRLSLPVSRDPGRDETPGMVRLQMIRQLTVVSEGTVIDYVPLHDEPDGDTPPGGALMQEVFAGALPSERMAHYQKLARAAGLKVKQIGLRCFGLGVVLAELSQRRDGPVLGMALGRGAVEFVIVENGQVTLARAADMPRPPEGPELDAYADRIAVEAKRTLASARAAKSVGEPVLTAIIGDRSASERAAQACARALETPVQCVEAPASVEFDTRIGPVERSELTPLLGLLLAAGQSIPMLDFGSPRRAVDPAERRRKMGLVAALVALAVGGAGFVLSQERLAKLEKDAKSAESRRAVLEDEHLAYLRAHARWSHLQRWSDARVDWIAHVKLLNEQMPDASKAVLDSLAGAMKAGVTYTPSGREYLDGRWALKETAEFTLAGRVRERDAATELRGRLLAGKIYQVENRGPDVPDRFGFELVTTQRVPQPPPAPQPAAAPEPPGEKGDAT